MTSGGGGVSQKVILHDEGGGPDPPNKDDIIYEQPLTQVSVKYLLNFIFEKILMASKILVIIVVLRYT